MTIYAQHIPLPENLPQQHPRLAPTSGYEAALARINPYMEKVEKEPHWLLSRLMMYWKSHATQVYINGGVYSHADGRAPVPTVRFGSTRGVSSVFKRPKIEDIIPYMDDTKGIYFRNSAKEGSPLEWIDQANASGGSIESVNTEIMRLAKDASLIYQTTKDEKYAKLAFGVFDTYLTGMYYRTEPIDLGNGHAQTLVGMSTFEVIQEGILHELAYTYDFLHSYIAKNHPEKIDTYAAALKKWIDITIKNGVPHNNWNLHQAKHILKVAMVLEDNNRYADRKGREYYIDYILNRTSARQWSLTKFMEYGYDYNTGIWNECPGYSIGVTRDLSNFISDYKAMFNQDLLPYFPVMQKAMNATSQYLFPNGFTTAFGDTYYNKLNNKPLEEMRHYITQTFYAPNVSWFVQRNKYNDAHNGLMISQYASYGNHAHSNGVAMELYGKGYILGAESGIGSSYFEKPYLEYYSQFPAHNTVMVDGISKYPEMLSNHPFDLLSCYPEPGQQDGYYPGISFSDVYFLEPESRSDQNRLLSIVRTGETTGYYVDIFRSRKQRGGDKFHDYFYHNLGQELFIDHADGQAIDLQTSDEMAFAGGHLFALDYMWDKKSARTNNHYQATWKMAMPDDNHIYMHLWMKGTEGREVFSIKAPPCKAFRTNDLFPYEVNKSPYLTIAARQHGEAWEHPFVSIFEPATEKEGRSIESIQSFQPEQTTAKGFVGLIVKSKQGRTDYIFSTVNGESATYHNMTTSATYAVISQQGEDFTLFMGNGKKLIAKGFTIEAEEATNAILEYKNGRYYLACNKPVSITTPNGKQISEKGCRNHSSKNMQYE